MGPVPQREDKVPDGLDWDLWLGVAKERPYISGYYHPGNWRKRRDFGTGTLVIWDAIFLVDGIGL